MILLKTVEDFEQTLPSRFPGLLDKASVTNTSVAEDTVTLTYALKAKYGIDDVMDIFEDQMEFSVLYDFEVSRDVLFGRQCCAYADTKFDSIVKVNATTNQHGLVDQLTITLYESVEVMVNDLIADLRRHSSYGCLRFAKSIKDLLIEFC